MKRKVGEYDDDDESDSDDYSTMPKGVKRLKLVFQFMKHYENFRSPGQATPAHKNHRVYTKTKKRSAKDNSTPAKKSRHSENKKKNNGKWKCPICTHRCSTWKDFIVHVNSAHKEEKKKKARKTTKWQCGLCERSYISKGNLQRHVRTSHSKNKITKVQCRHCERKYTTKENLNRHVKTAHSDDTRKAVAAVTKKIDPMKDNEKNSNNNEKVHSVAPPKEVAAVTEKTVQMKEKPKGKVHSGPPLKEDAALREKTGVIKDTSHSAELPRLPVKKFTEYECTCGKTENTYDASVRHAQEHLVEWDALIRENGPQCELKFDRDNCGNNNNDSFLKTKFDYKTLLDHSWYSMFERTKWLLSILASSLYKYTRCVKLHWDSEKKGEGHFVPLYKCSACDLFVEPTKVERHCENYQACMRYKGHKCSECQKCFNSPIALKLHKIDHDTYKNLRFRIVTFNNEDDEQFNVALRRMSLLPQAEKKENISGSPETPVRDQKNDVHNAEIVRVLKYCSQCERTYSDFEDHSAYHKNERKRIMEAIAREQQSCSAEAVEAAAKKQNNDNTEKEAEPEENVSDRGSFITEWNSDGDSDDDDRQSFNTFNSQAQLNLTPKLFGRIVTKKDEIKQKPHNDCRKLQGNRKNDDDAVKEVKGQPDQFDPCELTLGKIFGEDNSGVDTLESDNESQSTEDLQRVLEGDAESILSGDE